MNSSRTSPQGLSASDSNISRSVISGSSTSAINVTTRVNNSKRIRLDDDDCNVFDMFRDEIRDMLSDWMKQQDDKLQKLDKGLSKLDNLEKGLAEIKTGLKVSNDEIEKSFGELSAQIKDLDKKIDILDHERINTRVKIEELEEKSEGLERMIRKTCIEIRGVPKKKKEKKEDLLNMVTSLMKSIGSDCCTNEIKDIYRLPSKANATTSAVVTEFTNTFAKDQFLREAKKYNTSQPGKQINTRHLGLEGSEMSLFVSDHLTSKAKRLLFLARDFARSENFQYCWIANGRILLRKKEGDKYTVVKSENTFQQLRETYKVNN